MGFADDHLVPLIDEGSGNSARGLAPAAADVPPGPVVACRHGERAMTAAGLPERAGHRDIAVLDGGPADYAGAQGRQLVHGTEDSRS
ncbi:hypothetical protein [Streptomyces sp. NPDC058145]|uniref:hypothetical protein n=1 Tax=Streptomyces sp. NPDC058145 TaxID=3346356 RepID=UPI0036E07828